MVTTLYLVRHGETEGKDRQCYHGSTDVRLSDRGITQIKCAAAFIARRLIASSPDRHNNLDNKLAAVYCSSLERAIKSAEIIAAPYGLKPVELPDLAERSFGIWEGMTFSEIGEKHPEAFAAWFANPVTYNPGGGENVMQVRERVTRAMERIGTHHKGSHISVVAHGGVNRIIICHILGMPLENVFRIEQDYGAVNIIEFWDAYPVVKLMNGPPLADRDSIQEEGQYEYSFQNIR